MDPRGPVGLKARVDGVVDAVRVTLNARIGDVACSSLGVHTVSNPTLRYCCIWGWEGGQAPEATVDADRLVIHAPQAERKGSR